SGHCAECGHGEGHVLRPDPQHHHPDGCRKDGGHRGRTALQEWRVGPFLRGRGHDRASSVCEITALMCYGLSGSVALGTVACGWLRSKAGRSERIRGNAVKLCGGGGQEVAHSSEQPCPHGSSTPTIGAFFAVM